MEIWKSLYMFGFIQKQYPEKFAFLILINLALFTCEVCIFLKNYPNFKHILLFLCVCKQPFHISSAHISKTKMSCVKPLSKDFVKKLFWVKTDIVVGFDICVSLALNHLMSAAKSFIFYLQGIEGKEYFQTKHFQFFQLIINWFFSFEIFVSSKTKLY